MTSDPVADALGPAPWVPVVGGLELPGLELPGLELPSPPRLLPR